MKIKTVLLTITGLILCLTVLTSCYLKTVVPGGIMDFSSNNLSADSSLVITFDRDIYINNGGEVHTFVPLSPYTDGGDTAEYYIPWQANSDLEPGSYYVYFWVDFDGSGTINLNEEAYNMVIYPSADYINYDYTDINNMYLYRDGPLTYTYRYWKDTAPDINDTMNILLVF